MGMNYSQTKREVESKGLRVSHTTGEIKSTLGKTGSKVDFQGRIVKSDKK